MKNYVGWKTVSELKFKGCIFGKHVALFRNIITTGARDSLLKLKNAEIVDSKS